LSADDALSRLAAGLDTDERIARAATKLPQPTLKHPNKRAPWGPERWEIDRFGDLTTVNGDGNPIQDEGGVRDDETAAHMANWSPKRVLDVVEAIRKIAASHTRDDYYELDDETIGSCARCSNYCDERGCRNVVPWPCPTLRVLADIYTEESE